MSSGQIEDVVLDDNLYEGAPAWLETAAKELGQDETNPYSRIPEYFKASKVAPDPKGTPWCKYFVTWVLLQHGIVTPAGGMARSMLTWGSEVTAPKPGDIAVLWRGTHDDGVTGHVGFFVKEDGQYVYLIGGNQGDKVTEAKFDKKKVLGYRRYRSIVKSKTVWTGIVTKIAGGGVIADAIMDAKPSVEQLVETKGVLEQALQYFPNYKIMLGVLIIGLGLYIVYNKNREKKEAGV